MKPEIGHKYKVLVDIMHSDRIGQKDSENFMLFKDEEFEVKSVWDSNGSCLVDLGTYKNDFNETKTRMVSLETFTNFFEKI